jgi:hypothetical protein
MKSTSDIYIHPREGMVKLYLYCPVPSAEEAGDEVDQSHLYTSEGRNG